MTTSDSNRVPSGTGAGVPAGIWARDEGRPADCAAAGAAYENRNASRAPAAIALMNDVDPRTFGAAARLDAPRARL